MGCYYFTMYHVILSLQHDIHEDCDDADDEISTPWSDIIHHVVPCKLQIVSTLFFVFQKLNLLSRRMDVGGGGEEQRKGKKEKILKVTTDSGLAWVAWI